MTFLGAFDVGGGQAEIRRGVNRNAVVPVGEKHYKSAARGAGGISPHPGGVDLLRHQPLKQEVADDIRADSAHHRRGRAHSRRGHRLVRTLAPREKPEI